MKGRYRSNPLDRVVSSMIAMAKKVKKNVAQGQKDFKAGKIGYRAINPLKK